MAVDVDSQLLAERKLNHGLLPGGPEKSKQAAEGCDEKSGEGVHASRILVWLVVPGKPEAPGMVILSSTD